MWISVTKQDIQQGIPRKSSLCPIALAVKRRFPDLNIYVLPYGIFYRRTLLGVVSRPDQDKIADFINAFDQRHTVNPFRFRLEV